jgi:hypothetical protein
MRSVLQSYERMTRWPGGRWLFSRLVCFRAPYFASIPPLIETLARDKCVVSIRHRRSVFRLVAEKTQSCVSAAA